MSDTAKKPVLFLRSTSRNFPVDLLPELERAGYNVSSVDGLEEFISSKIRSAPFLAVMEIGSLPDLERAHLVYEWVEQTQPLAPARFLLLLASKNLQVGDKLRRFGASTEVAMLPQPARNLLFKLELQQRLLASRPVNEKPRGKGFSAQLEPDANGRQRILVARGPDDKAGDWRQGESTPQGKIRWRWVKQPDPRALPEASDQFTWLAECAARPVFDKARDAWIAEGDAVNLVCLQGEKTVYSAAELHFEPRAAPTAASTQKDSQTAEPAAPAEKQKRSIEADERAADLSAPENAAASTIVPVAKEKTTSEKAAPRPEKEKPENPFASKGEPAARAEREKPKALRDDSPRAKKERESGEEEAPQEPEADQESSEKLTPAGEKKAREKGADHSATPAAPPWGAKNEPKRETLKEKIAAALRDASASKGELGDEESGRSTSVPSLQKESVPPTEAVPGKTSTHLSPQALSTKAETHIRTLDPLAAPELVKYGTGHPYNPAEKEKQPATPGSPAAPVVKEKTEAPPPDSASTTAPPLLKMEEAQATPPRAHDFSFDSNLPPLSLRGTSDQTIGSSAALLPQETRISQEQPAFSSDKNKGAAGGAEKAGQREILPGTSRAAGDAGNRTITGGDARAGADYQTPESKSGSSRKEEDASRRFLHDRLYLLMTLAELSDKQSSWHPVGKYRIYLSAQHRYYGLPHPGEVLPLWIYEGELAPEFIDEKKSWKFYDRLPASVYSLDLLPQEVLVYIYQMAGLALPEKGAPSLLPAAGADTGSARAASTATTPARDHYQPEKEKETSAWSSLVSFIRGLIGG